MPSMSNFNEVNNSPLCDGGQRWLATGEGTSARHNAKKNGEISHQPLSGQPKQYQM